MTKRSLVEQPAKKPISLGTDLSRTTTARRNIALLNLTLLLIGFSVLLYFMPLRTALQIGADEGFELAKATLCLKGYQLYSQIWNDQPPLHTFVITQILRHISHSVLGPRLLSVTFALVLLTSLFIVAHRFTGTLAATVTVALLIVSPGFLELSASCMLEIPSLACALAAFWCLSGGFLNSGFPGWRTPGAIILGALLFACALQIKLVPAYMMPLAGLLIWMKPEDYSSRDGSPGAPQPPCITLELMSFLRRCAVFAITIMISYVIIDLLLEKGAYLLHFRQSLSSHFGATKTFEFGSADEHRFDWSILLKNWDTLIPAVMGIGVCCRQMFHARTDEGRHVLGTSRRSNRLLDVIKNPPTHSVPVLWLLLSLAVFALHKPWWAYYYVHTAVPLCWCAGVGMVFLIRKLSRLRTATGAARLIAFVIFSGSVCTWAGARAYLEIKDAQALPKIFSTPVIGRIGRLKPIARFLYVEDSIYSFHADIPMPPDLAVLPLKRFWAGEMTAARFLSDLAESRPEIILLANDSKPVLFQQFLESDYRLTYIDARHRLYVRRDAPKAVR